MKKGDVFGKWTVVSEPYVNARDGHRHVAVQCVCGFERDLNVRYLASGESRSCERVDNSKGYSPDNCRWATRSEQGRNRRTNRLVEFCGEVKCLQAWIEELGLNGNTVRGRLRRGWPAERAFSKKEGDVCDRYHK